MGSLNDSGVVVLILLWPKCVKFFTQHQIFYASIIRLCHKGCFYRTGQLPQRVDQPTQKGPTGSIFGPHTRLKSPDLLNRVVGLSSLPWGPSLRRSPDLGTFHILFIDGLGVNHEQPVGTFKFMWLVTPIMARPFSLVRIPERIHHAYWALFLHADTQRVPTCPQVRLLLTGASTLTGPLFQHADNVRPKPSSLLRTPNILTTSGRVPL